MTSSKSMSTRGSRPSYKDRGDAVIVSTCRRPHHREKAYSHNSERALQKAQTILQKAYYRSYCIAIQAPKGAYKDVLLYDNGDPNVYVRETAYHNSKYEYTAVRTTKLGRRLPRLRKAL